MTGCSIEPNTPSPREVTSSPSAEPTRILIGGAGAPNYGDELIVKGWLDHFSEPHHVGGKFIFFENSADTSHKFHFLGNHPLVNRVQFRDDFTEFAKSVTDLTFWQQVERGHTFMRDFGFLSKNYKGSREIFDAASLHLHGGGYFCQAKRHMGFFLGLAASLAKIYGMPAFATGVGLGPFHDECPDPARFAEIMSYFKSFETRDADSHRLLLCLAPLANLVQGVDDSFILPNDRIFRRESSVRRLQVSLITRHLGDLPPSFWPWLVKQSAAFDEVKFWVSFPWEDQEAIARLQEEIPRSTVITARESVHFRPPIGDSDVFISQRFHVHLAAARAGAAGFYLAHTPYDRQKHQSLVELGSGLAELDAADLPDLADLAPHPPLDDRGLQQRKLGVYSAPCSSPPA